MRGVEIMRGSVEREGETEGRERERERQSAAEIAVEGVGGSNLEGG